MLLPFSRLFINISQNLNRFTQQTRTLTIHSKMARPRSTSTTCAVNGLDYSQYAPCQIAVGQMTSTNDLEHNFKQITALVQMAKNAESKMLFLPEACDYIGESTEQSLKLADHIDGKFVTDCRELARKNDLWLSLGGVHELVDKGDKRKIYNSHLIIDNAGTIKTIYRKVHLVDISIPEENLDVLESRFIEAGECLVPPCDTPFGHIGLSICFDLRFPELGIINRQKGAQILTYPSAFIYETGVKHWQQLLQARAIETQCYVVAAAQVGAHNKDRISYGHSMVIDPWGEILCECPKHDVDVDTNPPPTVCTATLDLRKLGYLRRRIPAFQSRRDDLYRNLAAYAKFPLKDVETFEFGDKIRIPQETVFYRTNLTYAFTNIRCVVPGHVLVAPIRKVKRLPELTSAEITDLFESVIKVQKVLEKVQNADSSTVTVQDGVNAGQTVQHVHVHILPRKAGDFLHNDEIYLKLAKHDTEPEQPRRTLQEQIDEANLLRSHF